MVESRFIPVEFSGGAFRFGHAQIRETYDVNSSLLGVPIFPSLVGICPVTPDRQVDWKLFFEFDGSNLPQPSRRIRPQLVPGLMRLPEALVGRTPRPEFSSLAQGTFVVAIQSPCPRAKRLPVPWASARTLQPSIQRGGRLHFGCMCWPKRRRNTTENSWAKWAEESSPRFFLNCFGKTRHQS